MVVTADSMAATMTEALTKRLGEKVAEIEQAYDVDYRAEAPIGLEGPPSSGSRSSARLNDALVTRSEQLGPLSWTIHVEVDDERAPHGKWIDQPTDLIVPVNAKVLRWFGYRTGQPIFARSVVPSREHEGWWAKWTDRLGEVTSAAWDRGGA